jgi:hypothetical protein
MPSSKKGKSVKRITRYPVPIPAGIAAKLRVAAGNRPKSAPLLLQADGTAWNFEVSTHRAALQRAVQAAGLPAEVTLYWLRHSSIARDLLAGVPIRLVAVKHDTSIAMIERTYSKYIAGPGDAQLRRAMLDITSPAADNVFTMSGRRP